jgi:hypothetical protein
MCNVMVYQLVFMQVRGYISDGESIFALCLLSFAQIWQRVKIVCTGLLGKGWYGLTRKLKDLVSWAYRGF